MVLISSVLLRIVYDEDYWSFVKDEQHGSYDENNHSIVNSDSSLETMIFRKYHHVLDLLEKLNKFVSVESHLEYDC